MMALCSFGGVSDHCGATSWAAHETGMVPLLSCAIDMTEWLKEKCKGSGASGARERTGHTKATGDSKYQLGSIHAHKWLLSRSSELFLLNRDHDILRFCRLKLFISQRNLLGSCEEKLTFKVPLRSNFRILIKLHFSRPSIALTYLFKPFFNQRTGSLFFRGIFFYLLLSAVNKVCSNRVARGSEAS